MNQFGTLSPRPGQGRLIRSSRIISARIELMHCTANRLRGAGKQDFPKIPAIQLPAMRSSPHDEYGNLRILVQYAVRNAAEHRGFQGAFTMRAHDDKSRL